MKKQVNYKVNGKEWEEAKDRAFAKLVKKVKVDGFREGKVPRNIFEKKYGTGDINSEAMEEVLEKKYAETLINEKLYPIVEPKLEIVSMDDNGFEANVTFILEPEVMLGKYKGLKVKKEKVEVTKEEIEHEISHILDRYAELVSKEGKVEEGDTVVIDFKGFKDNEAFDGGSADGYSLEIGSHSFIPGFEEAIVGMEKGESKDINLTFPEDYMAEDLKGQDVVFNVVVHDIKKRVVPELDEEFFKDLDIEGVSNKEELENVVEKELKAQKEDYVENKFEYDLLKKAVENTTIELEQEIIDMQRDRLYEEFINRLSMYGIDEELYYTYTGNSKEDVLNDMTKDAERRLKNSYLLEAIAKEEKIEVSDEEIEKEIIHFVEHHHMTEEEVKNELGGREAISYNIMLNKALNIIKENN